MANRQLPLHGTLDTLKGYEPSLWLTIILLLLLLGKVIATVYFANTTFDFTDGGGYMLWYAHPDKDPHPFYYFHRIVLGLFPFIDWNIISLRILKMASELVVISAMTFAVYQNLDSLAKGAKSFLFVFGFIGLAYFSTWFSWIFYENDMTYLHAVVALSLVLGGMQVRSKWLYGLMLLLAGIITGIQFFNKFSTCLLLLVAIPIVVQVCRPGWKNLVVFFIGIALGVVSFFYIVDYSVGQWYQEYLDGYKYYMEPLGYHPLRLIWLYILNLWPLPLLAVSPLLIWYLLQRLAGLGGFTVSKSLLFAISVLLLTTIYYFTFPHKYLNHDNPAISKLYYYWYFPLFSLLMFLAASYLGVKQFTKQQWMLLGLWFLLPAFVFVGTSTTASLSLASFLAPWYGLLAYLLVRYYRPTFKYPILVIAFFSCFVFFANHIQRPYWTNKPMYHPRVAVQAPNEVIMLDTVTAQFVLQTKEILIKANIEPGYPVVALHDLPGLVYLVGGYSPATPWYFNVLDARQSELKCMIDDFNCLHIGRIKLFEKREPIFMINELSYYEVLPCLSANGYDLYTEYEPPKKVSNPTIRSQIMRYSKGASDSLLIFLPKRPYTQKLVVN